MCVAGTSKARALVLDWMGKLTLHIRVMPNGEAVSVNKTFFGHAIIYGLNFTDFRPGWAYPYYVAWSYPTPQAAIDALDQWEQNFDKQDKPLGYTREIGPPP